MNDDVDSSRALVPASASEVQIASWDSVKLQRLWISVAGRQWGSLAILGASEGIDTGKIAETIAHLAWRYQGEPAAVCDFRDLSVRLVDYQLREMHAQVEQGTRMVVALRSIFENPTASLIAKRVDCVVLCIALGKTALRAAEQTVAAVGREHFIGSFVVRPPSKKNSKPPPRA